MKIKLITNASLHDVVAIYGTETRRLRPLWSDVIEGPRSQELLVCHADNPQVTASHRIDFNADVRIDVFDHEIRFDVRPMNAST